MTGLIDGVSAVVFDFFGTLTPSAPPEIWLRGAERVAAVMGVEGRALNAAFGESFYDRVTGVLGDLPQTMQTLAGRLGVPLTGERLDAVCRIRRQVQRERFALRPEAMTVIGWLHAREKKIGVLSDCTIELSEAWSQLPVSAAVDAAVFSCVTGLRKPDPRLFAMVAERLGVSPRDCLYVGDGGGRELSGARSAGMRAVLLAGDDWHSHAAHDRERDWDGLRVRSLGALCA